MESSLIEQSPPKLLKYIGIKSHSITKIEIILLLLLYSRGNSSEFLVRSTIFKMNVYGSKFSVCTPLKSHEYCRKLVCVVDDK